MNMGLLRTVGPTAAKPLPGPACSGRPRTFSYFLPLSMSVGFFPAQALYFRDLNWHSPVVFFKFPELI